ncbi:MAG: O-antigen ligase family protein [Candidatus Saccharimonadales bacterium]
MRYKNPFSIKAVAYVVAAVMLISPFYTPLYVWAVSNFENFYFFRVWKELALIVVAAIIVNFIFHHLSLLKQLMRKPIIFIPLAYILFILIVAAIDFATGRVSYKAILQGLILDLRLPGFFLLVLLAASVAKDKLRGLPWLKIIFFPAGIVTLFGLMQMFILSDNILTHIGYGPQTVTPYQLVDQNPDFVRVQSTLPGPNPLGAYLLLVITLSVALILTTIKKSPKLLLLVGAAAILLFGSYSRSAEIGTIIALAVLFGLSRKKAFARHTVAAVGIVLITLSSLSFFWLRDNDFIQNAVFHSSEVSPSQESSNAQRLEAIKGGAKDIINNPLGGGVGSAGPASRRNLNSEPKISENYFVQIGQELGVAGLILFLSMLGLIIKELWKVKDQPLGRALLASLAGITFINLVSHAWTDDTLAYLWWGLAGVACSPVILPSKQKADAKVIKI